MDTPRRHAGTLWSIQYCIIIAVIACIHESSEFGTSLGGRSSLVLWHHPWSLRCQSDLCNMYPSLPSWEDTGWTTSPKVKVIQCRARRIATVPLWQQPWLPSVLCQAREVYDRSFLSVVGAHGWTRVHPSKPLHANVIGTSARSWCIRVYLTSHGRCCWCWWSLGALCIW